MKIFSDFLQNFPQSSCYFQSFPILSRNSLKLIFWLFRNNLSGHQNIETFCPAGCSIKSEFFFCVSGDTESSKKIHPPRKGRARRVLCVSCARQVLCVSCALIGLCIKKLQRFAFRVHEIRQYKITTDNQQEQRNVIQHDCRQENTPFEVLRNIENDLWRCYTITNNSVPMVCCMWAVLQKLSHFK